MRILLLSTYFQPDIASTGVLMTQLAEELAALGHQITVITSMPHYDINRIWDQYQGRLVVRRRQGAIDVYHLYLYVPGRKKSFSRRALNYASFNLLAMIGGIMVGRHDVILVPSPPLTNGIAADVISRFWKTPFVYNVQDVWPDVVIRAGVMRGRRIIAICRRMEHYVYKRASRLSVISQGFKKNLMARGVPAHKIKVIPNFFDTDFIQPLARRNGFRSRHGLDHKFVILFAGNIGYSQGLETIVDAAAQLSEFEDMLFLIVGNGVAQRHLKSYVQNLAMRNVRFLPFQPYEALPEMYAAADVCLVPLRKGFTNESVPCKVFSIMASGKPMVASVDEGSDTWDLVKNADCGICTQPEDSGAVSDAIRILYHDDILRERLGKNGRRLVVEHYNRRAIARQYEELLASLVG